MDNDFAEQQAVYWHSEVERLFDESERPFGLGPGEQMIWKGLQVTRREEIWPNWRYDIRAGDRAYWLNIFHPKPEIYKLNLRRRGGGVVHQPVEVMSLEEAVRLGLEIVCGLRGLNWPVKLPDYSSYPATYATFTLYGWALDPGEVSRRTGLTPTDQMPAPHVLQLTHLGPWRDGYWGLSSADSVDSPNLADHIRWVLDRIEPVKDSFPAWVSTWGVADTQNENCFCARMVCYWHEGAQYPVLDAEVLNRLADINLRLELDIYCSGAEDEPATST